MIWFGIDWTYVVFVIPAIIFAVYAQIQVMSSFKKYSKVYSQRRITGYEAARRVLDSNGLYHVKIEKVRGELTDHYDPRTNVIRLSEAVHDSTSVGAIGVACHEVGHAIQYAQNYAPIKIRSAIIPATNFGSMTWPFVVILGFLFSMPGLIYFGIALLGIVCLFQLVTLPVEFNASRRAMASLTECGIVYDEEEKKGARKVLTAAALTYVAALVVSLANLLRLLVLANGGRNRR